MTARGMDRGRRLLERVIAGIPAEESPLRHVEQLPARTARHAPWPTWAPDEVVAALRSAGAEQPWIHQAEGAEAAWHGNNVVVATGTASGKSMVYQLSVLSRLRADSRATALYLSPTDRKSVV